MESINKYYVECLDGETFDEIEYNTCDYGVFHIDRGSHCFYYGSETECNDYISKLKLLNHEK